MAVLNPAAHLTQLELSQEGSVARVSLNQPDRYNALSFELMRELRKTLETIAPDPAVQVVILQGSGRGFSAGHDLSEMIGCDDSFYESLFDECTRLMQTIRRMPQPVIAQVHGVATAAGCQLVASCDLAVATHDARFGTPGVKIGLFCSTPMVPLSRAVGPKRAMQMLLTGEMIDAPTAVDWGLINDVVAPEDLHAATDTLAAKITSASPRVVGLGKETFYAQVERDEDAAYELTKQVMARNASSPDAQEGMSAFVDKRAPVWPEV
jgi:enoyl-CoA hydratase/carnithine racemase